MDEKVWKDMFAALDMPPPAIVQAKLDHDLVRAYRDTFWAILNQTGADTSDFESCPPHGVCTPDIPIRAFNDVVELRARFNRLEQFVVWVAESEDMRSDPDDPSGGHRLNDMIDAAKEVLDDI